MRVGEKNSVKMLFLIFLLTASIKIIEVYYLFEVYQNRQYFFQSFVLIIFFFYQKNLHKLFEQLTQNKQKY